MRLTMRTTQSELKTGAGFMGMIESYRVSDRFDIPILNREWNPEDPMSRPTIQLRCRRWRVGEKDKIKLAATTMVAHYQEMGVAALADPIGSAFEGGVPNSDEAWNYCMLQSLIVGWVIVPASEGVAEILSEPPTDVQLATLVGQCPELCAAIVDGLDTNLKTQLSSAEFMAARLAKKNSPKTPPSTGRGGRRKPST